jgi:hypothetical protein
MTDRQLIEDLLSALEYHTEQTRPIEFSKVAIEAAREYLRKPAQRKPLTDDVHNAFLQGIRYAANKYEAVSDERFTGSDVSNFLLMEAEELDSSDITRAIEAAHGIKEKNT